MCKSRRVSTCLAQRQELPELVCGHLLQPPVGFNRGLNGRRLPRGCRSTLLLQTAESRKEGQGVRSKAREQPSERTAGPETLLASLSRNSAAFWLGAPWDAAESRLYLGRRPARPGKRAIAWLVALVGAIGPASELACAAGVPGTLSRCCSQQRVQGLRQESSPRQEGSEGKRRLKRDSSGGGGAVLLAGQCATLAPPVAKNTDMQ